MPRTGAASGRCNGCSITSRSIAAGAWSMRPTRPPTRSARLAASGAVAGLCPITEANLGDGTFNAPEFIERGGVFGIGSDSNVLIGVTDELRQLEYSQRLAHRARNVVAAGDTASTGRALFEARARGRIAGARRGEVRADRGRLRRYRQPRCRRASHWPAAPATPSSTAGFSAPAARWSIASGRGAARWCKDGRHHQPGDGRAALSSDAGEVAGRMTRGTEAGRAGRRRSISGSATISKPGSCPATGRRGIACRSSTN